MDWQVDWLVRESAWVNRRACVRLVRTRLGDGRLGRVGGVGLMIDWCLVRTALHLGMGGGLVGGWVGWWENE